MLAKIFKKNVSSNTEDKHPALDRLSKLGLSSAMCTLVKTADGREICDEVGTVSFYQKEKRLFIRGRALFLAPPAVFGPGRNSEPAVFPWENALQPELPGGATGAVFRPAAGRYAPSLAGGVQAGAGGQCDQEREPAVVAFFAYAGCQGAAGVSKLPI